MGELDKPTPAADYARLFFGALVQWGLASAFGRYLVLGGYVGVFVTVFIGQSLWWVNIQQTTRDGHWTRWAAWTLGAAIGAVIGKWVT